MPDNNTLPATPPNTLPSHDVPGAAGATQPKPSDRTDFEEYNLAAGMEDFELSLLDYGRSIMNSAVNDDCDSQTLVNDMNATKEKVIAHYTIICQHLEELSHSLDAKDVEASNLKNEIAELQRAKAAMEEEKSDVIQAMDVDYAMKKKEAEDHCAEKEKYQKLWEEAEKGRKEAEDELAGIKQDNKRKRDRMEKMWGNVEREVGQ
jgi:chromosome segregation ATPase